MLYLTNAQKSRELNFVQVEIGIIVLISYELKT